MSFFLLFFFCFPTADRLDGIKSNESQFKWHVLETQPNWINLQDGQQGFFFGVFFFVCGTFQTKLLPLHVIRLFGSFKQHYHCIYEWIKNEFQNWMFMIGFFKRKRKKKPITNIQFWNSFFFFQLNFSFSKLNVYDWLMIAKSIYWTDCLIV